MEIPSQASRMISNKDDPAIAYFLGNENRAKIQRLMAHKVYEETNGKIKIGSQSETALQVVMIHTLQKHYDQYLPIVELNRKVLEVCVPNILTNVGYYLDMMRDRNNQNRGGGRPDLLVAQSSRSSRESAYHQLF